MTQALQKEVWNGFGAACAVRMVQMQQNKQNTRWKGKLELTITSVFVDSNKSEMAEFEQMSSPNDPKYFGQGFLILETM